MAEENKAQDSSETLPEKPQGSDAKKKQLALKFISGKFVGGMFTMPEQGELTIGRGSDSEITIAEDMVSRRHARLLVEPGNNIFIEDLKSTNGTFINGERIQKTSLHEGDRILIGTSILKLVTSQEETRPSRRLTLDSDQKGADGSSQVRTRITGMPPPAKTMEGVLDEIPLTDILQMFSSTKKSGVLNLEWNNRTANIYLRGGSIVYAAYGDLYDMSGRKALFRLLGLQEGKFSMLQYTDPPEFAELINEPTEFLIMEGLRRLDEQRHIEEEKNLRGSRFQFNFPMLHPLKKLSAEELDIFQMLLSPLTYETLLDRSPYEDLETAQILTKLLDEKYVRKNIPEN
jgi:pSer/pThr/pTyr-binding forkhead associated (FHA) protein